MSFDNLFNKKIRKLLTPEAKPEKIIKEVSEHLNHYKQVIFCILIPLMFFYFGIGLFRDEYVGGAAVFALIASFYSSFLPEADLLIAPNNFLTKRIGRIAKPHEKYLILCFAPLYLYLVATKRITPLFVSDTKSFHNLKSFFVFFLFLFGVGFALYISWFKALFLSIFGAVGYLTHLTIDRIDLFPNREFGKNRQKYLHK